MKAKYIIYYWIITILVCIPLVISGIFCVTLNAKIVSEISHLGYPHYFVFFLGIAKILGVLTLLTPSFKKIKEWAYAGFTFNMLFSIISHIAVKDPPSEAIVPTFILFILFASYYFYSRTNNNLYELISNN